MGKATQPYKRTLSGSIGAGMGSLFRASGRQYYILEHKMNSKYHKAGESQEIIVSQIELGRAPQCQVRFDESFTTVSQRHAAIVKDGDRWKLVHLSKTNPTFLNGRPVHHEWYLQNGDDIQLSVGGPRLGFIIPTGNKSTVGSIGLSRRLSLFRQQALKPYKTAITVLSVALCLLVAGSVTWGILDAIDDAKYKRATEALIAELKAGNEDAIKDIIEINQNSDAYKKEIERLRGEMRKWKPQIEDTTSTGKKATPPIGEITKCFPYVFAIVLDKIVATWAEGNIESKAFGHIHGTGFLLDDGRFVSARHVIETWYYYEYSGYLWYGLNVCANNGGKVVAYYTAISSSGLTFSFTSDQFKYNRNSDVIDTDILDNGTIVVVKKAVLDASDWAYYQTNEKEGLNFNKELSSNLQVGTELETLGFPQERGGEDKNNITPIYSGCKVARQGLDVDGTIMVSNDNTEPGNSGGLVLFKNKGVYQVVGIVSGNTYQKGRIAPISAVR